MLKLNTEYVTFIKKNAPDMVRFLVNDEINNANQFLDEFYDWIDEYGFDDEGYYNSLGNKAQKIYDFVYQNS